MRVIRILIRGSVVAALVPALLAQQEKPAPTPAPTTTTIQVQQTKLLRVGGDVTGGLVVTPKNVPLGKVEDLVIHPRGEIAFVELSGAGTTRTGAYRYPVPWRALDRNEHGQLVLATTPEEFVKYPRYDKPDLSAMDWWNETDRAYAKVVAEKASPAEAAVSLAPAKKMYLASDLRARPVENPDGEKVAMMHEIVVDPRAGRIAYVVLAVGGAAGAGEKMIAVPWESVQLMPDKANPKLERLTLSTTREQLEKAPEFVATAEGWTAASEPAYVLHVYESCSIPPYRIEVKEAPKQ